VARGFTAAGEGQQRVAQGQVQAAREQELRAEGAVGELAAPAGRAPAQVRALGVGAAEAEGLGASRGQQEGGDGRKEQGVGVGAAQELELGESEGESQSSARVASPVTRDTVVLREQPGVRRHGGDEQALGAQDARDLGSHGSIVVRVLEDVEEADEVEALVAEGEGLDRGAHAATVSARAAAGEGRGLELAVHELPAERGQLVEEAADPGARVEHAQGSLAGKGVAQELDVDAAASSEPPVVALEGLELLEGPRPHGATSATAIISSPRLT